MRKHTDAAAVVDGVDETRVEPVPAARRGRVEAVGMPEGREAAAVLRRPVEQRQETALGVLDRQAEVTGLGEGDVHRRLLPGRDVV